MTSEGEELSASTPNVSAETVPEDTGVVHHDKVPSDQINLRFLLVSGKKTDMFCGPTETIDAVRNKIYQNWPGAWEAEKPANVGQIRILFRGKFLEQFQSTLESHKIPVGQTTTVHLVIRTTVDPQPEAAESEPKAAPPSHPPEAQSSRCCVIL
ncbi:hypothetical protein M427DRAFT_58059 [Gonapodya prolifera JEL478]|uniref:UBL3-like ubiquitin domain-containing protein n=1 Tax=Gonapodya prolifera (strain JEL478) TaxID=1344416 RepID=A0A139AAN6_GONPJ|nr:hypothetical protein M427DRAFT_58059 [Gonapodya prolifera JEL478]|eukprot:KXS13810.1 hypothetical protein M427DRAFT_58059 [Gonapodya prolifera JEL478]